MTLTEDKWTLAPPPLCRESWNPRPVGHWNWKPAAVTYSIDNVIPSERRLTFIAWNRWPLDDDYDMSMGPNGPSALTGGNKEGVLNLEFAASETIGHFTTEWWTQLRKDVKDHPRQRREIGHTAIIVGLFGLDRVHKYATELHPVFGMAALVETTQLPNSVLLQHWVLFARNWGTEGECASQPHDLPGVDLVLQFPWAPGKGAVAVDRKSCLRTNLVTQTRSVRIVANAGRSLAVSLPLADAAARARVSGELYLRWSNSETEPVPATCLAKPLIPQPEPDVGAYNDQEFTLSLQEAEDSPEGTKKALLAATRQAQKQYWDYAAARLAAARKQPHDLLPLPIVLSGLSSSEKR